MNEATFKMREWVSYRCDVCVSTCCLRTSALTFVLMDGVCWERHLPLKSQAAAAFQRQIGQNEIKMLPVPKSGSLGWHFLMAALEGENSSEWKSIVSKDAGNTINKEKKPGGTAVLFILFFYSPLQACEQFMRLTKSFKKWEAESWHFKFVRTTPFFLQSHLWSSFSRQRPSELPSCCLHTEGSYSWMLLLPLVNSFQQVPGRVTFALVAH